MLERYLKTLPQHIKDSNSELILFIKAYYNWLENNQVVYEYVNKEARTSVDSQEFRSYLKQELLAHFPEVVVNETLLLKHIVEFYTSRGTEDSLKFLFRVVFGLESEVVYPSQQIFKPSAAKWNLPRSIRFKLVTGVVSLETELITITTDDNLFQLPIYRIEEVYGYPGLYEAFFEVFYTPKISAGTVYTENFTGTLVPTTTKLTVVQGGTGFKNGDLFSINNQFGSGSVFRVTSLDSNSGIKTAKIIRYGNGYLTNFNHTFLPELAINPTIINNLTINVSGDTTGTFAFNGGDTVNRITESIYAVKPSYVQYSVSSPYLADYGYVGDVVSTNDTFTSNNTGTNSETACIISVELGYLLEYQGYHSTNTGIPSDTSYLQDDFYYQQFSYVIRVDKDIREYSNVVMNTVHPAGTKMFGEYTIFNNVDINVSISNKYNKNVVELVDASVILEAVYKVLSKQFNESVFVSDTTSLNVEKETVVEDQFVEEFITKSSGKFEYDDIVVEDSIEQFVVDKNINEPQTVRERMYVTFTKEPVQDEVLVSDTTSKNFQPGTVLEQQTVTDYHEFTASKNVSEESIIDDYIVKSINKNDRDITEVNEYGCIILNDGYYSFSDVVTENGTYWNCGYTEGETAFSYVSIGYLRINQSNNRLFINNSGDTLKIKGQYEPVPGYDFYSPSGSGTLITSDGYVFKTSSTI